MKLLRDYRLECCWLVLLIVLLLTDPVRTLPAEGFDWLDVAFDCDGWVGWCPPQSLQ